MHSSVSSREVPCSLQKSVGRCLLQLHVCRLSLRHIHYCRAPIHSRWSAEHQRANPTTDKISFLLLFSDDTVNKMKDYASPRLKSNRIEHLFETNEYVLQDYRTDAQLRTSSKLYGARIWHLQPYMGLYSTTVWHQRRISQSFDTIGRHIECFLRHSTSAVCMRPNNVNATGREQPGRFSSKKAFILGQESMLWLQRSLRCSQEPHPPSPHSVTNGRTRYQQTHTIISHGGRKVRGSW